MRLYQKTVTQGDQTQMITVTVNPWLIGIIMVVLGAILQVIIG